MGGGRGGGGDLLAGRARARSRELSAAGAEPLRRGMVSASRQPPYGSARRRSAPPPSGPAPLLYPSARGRMRERMRDVAGGTQPQVTRAAAPVGLPVPGGHMSLRETRACMSVPDMYIYRYISISIYMGLNLYLMARIKLLKVAAM